MAKKLHELEQERNALAQEMRSFNDSKGDSVWTDEDKTKWSEFRSKLGDLESAIEREKDLRALDHLNNITGEHEEEFRSIVENDALTQEEKENQIFEVYARHGFDALNAEQRSAFHEISKRALSIGTPSNGGYTVPKEFQSRVIEIMKAYGGVEQHAQVITTSDGRQMDWCVTDGTSDLGDFVAEGAGAGTQDITFSTVKIGAWKLTSKAIVVSNELLQDTGISLDDLIGRRIASRIGRKKADAIVNGTGSSQNKGLDPSVTATVQMAGSGTLTYQDINELIHSVDPAYRSAPGFRLAFNDKTLKLIENMTDKQGRPLLLPAVSESMPATILGYKFFIDQGIKDGASTNKFMYAGDFQRFIVRNVQGMELKRLTEKYAENDQTAFLAFHRFDTLLEDTAAIKALTWNAG